MVSVLGREISEKKYDLVTIILLLSGLGLILLSLFLIRYNFNVTLVMVSTGYILLALGITLIYVGHDDGKKDETDDRDRN